ncbi:ABC transporter ATP-binding protein [Paenibacillus sp. N1-5-1-14]|uniref:ABC transporter ATP-binding protein n=1 Tax=Paenibacillus radicibacter TaxID=2972488 RepID=UPI002158CBD8|nr:ABC transporter ATP-binding protein [Paenibacillus radicibacter]MCR8642771.1 ABC transporter ATP-binding protein [Paenibacillus radicibacter]
MLLQMEQITKKYGDFTANEAINFSLREGEVHAIVGENGAGKTTLMRMLYGMEIPTSGSIAVRGKEVSFDSPRDAIANGIGMVHQHFMLFPSFTVAENIVIGTEPSSAIGFNRKQAVQQVKALSEKYGMPVPPEKKVSECALGTQQRMEILKVLYRGADIIVLDEPTAVLTPIEVKELLTAIKSLASQGKSIILITHKLHEVMEVADRITVLRNGKVTGTLNKTDTNIEELSRLMVGRELAPVIKQEPLQGKPVLKVRNLSLQGEGGKPVVDQVNFTVHAGEIVGIAGVSGNGQTELIQSICGLLPTHTGNISLLGTSLINKQPHQIRQAGLAHVPEDRYQWGSAKDRTVLDNGIMGFQRSKQKLGILHHKALRDMVAGWVKKFDIKTSSIHNTAQNLSGGNLQKLIVARELAQETPFLITAEPTRGVDIGAMEFIHDQLLAKRKEGGAILLVSSELSEVLKLSDRILVIYEGKIVGEVNGHEATEEAISLLMAGGGNNHE